MGLLARRWNTWAQHKREMYADGHPNDDAKAVHRRYADRKALRLVPFSAVLEVKGRNSGRTIRFPLVTIRYQGDWYLVSMLGSQANWVLNAKAADGQAVLTRGLRRGPVRLVEIPADQRARIIKRYLLVAIGARPHIPISWRAPIDDYEAAAHQYPVFGITRRS